MGIQTETSRLREGRLVRWHQDKGFGFIRPQDGGRDVFVHISALPAGQPPEIGTALVFSAIDDLQGRGQRVVKALPTDVPRPAPSQPGHTASPGRVNGRADLAEPCGSVSPPGTRAEQRKRAPNRRDQTVRRLHINAQTLLVGLFAFACLAGAMTMVAITPIPLMAYPALSLVAYLMYARDKLSAIRGTWRVPESTLHLLELLGGWPGAYIAQQTMRHKTVKTSYQLVYWVIVCAHVGFWGLWIMAPEVLLSQLRPVAELTWVR